MGAGSGATTSGWSVNLTGINWDSNETLQCQVWAGAVGGDINAETAQQLGIVRIDKNSVTWLIKSEWGGHTFQLYAGHCPMSDGGAAFQEGNADCSNDYKPYDVHNYPLESKPFPLSPPATHWTFWKNTQEQYTTSSWIKASGGSSQEHYPLFPLPSFGDVYMSGHARICECID